MTDKETQETVTRLKAYVECFRRKTRCTRVSSEECNDDLCDGCNLNYAQGNVGEHLKDIETAIRVLEKQSCEDAVSRQRVIEELRYMDNNGFITRSVNHVVDDIRSIPSVKPLDNQQQWIPIKTRPLTDEEKELYNDGDDYTAYMFDCPLPESGDEVLITTSSGYVECTTFFNDDNYGAYFECYENVKAWMPLPAPYKGDEDD